jgi:hypothetical protein
MSSLKELDFDAYLRRPASMVGITSNNALYISYFDSLMFTTYILGILSSSESDSETFYLLLLFSTC